MAPQWARISDRIGRKPTLLIGSAGAMISASSFGLSSSLPMAIVARIFAGLVNPNVGVIDTYIGEMVSKEH
jgi:MFS family permease